MVATFDSGALRGVSHALASAYLVMMASAGCGGSSGGAALGGEAARAGTGQGGAKADDAKAGDTNGGTSNGSSPNAGASSGGVSSGGTPNGGASNGGASNGGTSGGGASNGGGSGAGGTTAIGGGGGAGGALGRGCPSTAPHAGATCLPTLVSVSCFYEDCAASGQRTVATCSTAIPEIGNPVQVWTVQTKACEAQPQCLGTPCMAGEVCVIFEGGARLGMCGKHSCGDGPIECDCVSFCHPACRLTPIGSDPAYTCSTCSDPHGCP